MHRTHRRAAVAAALLALSSPAQARRVLVLNDPTATTAEDVLVGAAVRDSLDDDPGTTVLGPTPARASLRARREADDAAEILKGARDKFEALELEAALKDAQRAVQKLDRFGALAGRTELHAAALGTLAAAQMLLGQNKRARAQLEALVALRPDFTPDPSLYNPQMLETFKAIRDEVKARKPKELRVVTLPTGAAVAVDGKLRGVSPLTVALTPGKHYVSAALPGFETAGQSVSADRAEVTLTLPRAPQGSAPSTAAARAVATGGDLPAEAFDLAKKLKADEVAVVARTPDGFVLVRAAADRSGAKVTRDAGPANTPELAMGTAERLLERPNAPVAAAPSGAGDGAGAASASADGAGAATTTSSARDGNGGPDSAHDGAGGPATASSTTGSTGALAASDGSSPDRTAGGSARSPDADSPGNAGRSAGAADAGDAPAETTATTPMPAPVAETAEVRSDWPLWAYAGYGAALLAAGGAGFTGWLAYRERRDFANARYQLAAEPMATRGKRLALYSDVLTGTAVLAAAGTLVLQLLSGPPAPTSAAAEPTLHAGLEGFSVHF